MADKIDITKFNTVDPVSTEECARLFGPILRRGSVIHGSILDCMGVCEIVMDFSEALISDNEPRRKLLSRMIISNIYFYNLIGGMVNHIKKVRDSEEKKFIDMFNIIIEFVEFHERRVGVLPQQTLDTFFDNPCPGYNSMLHMDYNKKKETAKKKPAHRSIFTRFLSAIGLV